MSKYDQITPNFNTYEFRCRGHEKGLCDCGGSAPVDRTLALALQALRDDMGVPLTVSSGFRCLAYNRVPVSEGGPGSNDESQHPKGKAADIVIPAMWTPDRMFDHANRVIAFKYGGIGVYDGFLHLDIREVKARWDERTE